MNTHRHKVTTVGLCLQPAISNKRQPHSLNLISLVSFPACMKSMNINIKYTQMHSLYILLSAASPLHLTSPGIISHYTVRARLGGTERRACACMCDYNILPVCVYSCWLRITFFNWKSVVTSCRLHPGVCLFTVLVWKRTCTQSFVYKHFSEGGNNLIVSVNPMWAEQEKQSSSQHLQLETFILKFFL